MKATNSKELEVFNTLALTQDLVDKITVDKISAFSFVPRTAENAKKPLYFVVATCGSKETKIRFYTFPTFAKEKFSVLTEGS